MSLLKGKGGGRRRKGEEGRMREGRGGEERRSGKGDGREDVIVGGESMGEHNYR